MQEKLVRIVVVDDHAVMREGVRLLLQMQRGLEVVGEAADAKAALVVAAECRPDLVIMDVRLPDGCGIETAVEMRQHRPGLRVILLSGFLDPDEIHRALSLGISGFVSKVTAFTGMVQAVQTVMQGKLFLCPEMTTALLQARAKGDAGPPEPQLTERDKDLLRLITDGRRNKEIAAQLHLSTKSVEACRSRLMRKLSCSTPAELVRYAIREQLVVA